MSVKQCRYCKQWRSTEDFETAGVVKGKRYYRHKCRFCKNEDVKRRKASKTEWLRKLKESIGCQVCGNQDHRVLDFHHNDGKEKEFSISDMRGYSKERVRKELNKCQVLCANCHRIVHYDEAWASG